MRLLAFILIAISVSGCGDNNAAQAPIEEPAHVTRIVQGTNGSQLTTREETISYPGQTTGTSQATVSAITGGTIQTFSPILGKYVRQGTQLASIKDTSGLTYGRSIQLEQLSLAKDAAEKSYKLAKRVYEKDGSRANKTARDLAKIQYDSAVLNYQSAAQGRTILAPISGFVTQTFVSKGDSVSPGQPLVVISQNSDIKVRFFVDAARLARLQNGSEIRVKQGQKTWQAKISSLSPEADEKSAKFLVESLVTSDKQHPLLPGTNVEVLISFTSRSETGTMFLPLAAIHTNQNTSTVFINDNGVARSQEVKIRSVEGETALVEIPEELLQKTIILEGSRILRDGDPISLQ